jgi:hypothetical protein
MMGETLDTGGRPDSTRQKINYIIIYLFAFCFSSHSRPVNLELLHVEGVKKWYSCDVEECL